MLIRKTNLHSDAPSIIKGPGGRAGKGGGARGGAGENNEGANVPVCILRTNLNLSLTNTCLFTHPFFHTYRTTRLPISEDDDDDEEEESDE